MRLVTLTPTGARPQALAHCAAYQREQTRRADLWIVVDDANPCSAESVRGYDWSIAYVRRSPWWRAGDNTQANNLLLGLRMARETDADALIIIEDDDWYSRRWLEIAEAWMADHALAGEGRSAYYNVGNGTYYRNHNTAHASLCATAIRRDVFPVFEDVLKRAPKFIDVALWGAVTLPKKVHVLPGDAMLHVGIKGMPGRGGIGSGHQRLERADVDQSVLRTWIGSDAARYNPPHAHTGG